MKELRKEFEKETGKSHLVTESEVGSRFTSAYILWLENEVIRLRNKDDSWEEVPSFKDEWGNVDWRDRGEMGT